MNNEGIEDDNANSNGPISSIVQKICSKTKTFPSVLLFEQQGSCDLDHEAMFGAENEDNILDPITEYMLNDSDGVYVPSK